MNILYFGADAISSTSFHRFEALKRLGHQGLILSPYNLLKNNNALIGKFHYYTGYKFAQKKVLDWLEHQHTIIKAFAPDIIWVNSGELFNDKVLIYLKTTFIKPIVLYNNDDPTGGRDGNRFNSLLKAIPYYDLCVVMRDINIEEYRKLGATKVIRLFMSYDEHIHNPENIALTDDFKSEVCFIGTWMRYENRDEFLVKLIENNVPVSIWGNFWQKSKYWDILKPFYRGKALGGKNYTAAIKGAKICLGFLSKGNRDLHTSRSLEIPFVGSVFCAERTSEHLHLYQDGVEAVFWDDAEECSAICKNLLNNDLELEKIKFAGMKKVRSLGVGNEDICRKILSELLNE